MMSATAPAGHSRGWDFALALTCLLPPVAALVLRPAMPLDELRYLAVAWEMWRDGHFLVPHINGATYAHKPPILFWLMHGGWTLFGVNEWWPRLIGGLAGTVTVFVTRAFARALWPEDRATSELVPWLLAGCLIWLFCGQMVMFDVLLSVWVVLGMWGIWRTATSERLSGWWLIGVAIGGGLLTKGPVVLLQILLPAVLAPLWQPGLRGRAWGWYGQLLGALLLGAAIALAWAIPAALSGGPDYAAAIFWKQTAGRMENSFAHARPWWFYLPVLPVLFLPWTILPSVWRRVSTVPRDVALRFLLTTVAAIFLALSMVSGKQPHYTVPMMPAIALIAARLLSRDSETTGSGDRRVVLSFVSVLLVAAAGYLIIAARKEGVSALASGIFWLLPALAAWPWIARASSLVVTVRRAALGMAVVCVALLGAMGHTRFGIGLDLRQPAVAVQKFQQEGAIVAALDHYQGQFTFMGRLERPIEIVKEAEFPAWAATHPGAYVFAFKKEALPGNVGEQVAEFPYRSRSMRIWRLGSPPATGLAVK